MPQNKSWEEVAEELEQHSFVPDRFIVHPEVYRDLRWHAHLMRWSEITNWAERWCAWLFDMEPQYEDIAMQIEKDILRIGDHYG